MIARTQDEVVEFCRALWGESTDGPIVVSWEHGNLTVTRMYGAPDLTLDHLMRLARFFGTMNVGKYDDIANAGCETCDYGSSYGFVLRVEDGPEPPPETAAASASVSP